MPLLKVIKKYPRSGRMMKAGTVYDEPSRGTARIMIAIGKAELHVEPAAEQPAPAIISESVAEFAAEKGIDPAEVDGTGKGGRILRRDVVSYMTRMMAAD